MVSLSSESTQRNGGFPFDEWSQSAHDTEELLEGPGSQQPQIDIFRKVNTTWSIVVVLLLTICLEVSLFVVPHVCQTGCGPPPYSLLVYCHGALWFIFMLADRYWRFQHYNSRTCGYLDFYRQTRHIRRIPILVYSGGTSLLLILSAILYDYCPRHTLHQLPDQCPGLPLYRYNYAQIIVSMEMAIIIPCLVVYLVYTVRFNRSRPAPDIHREDVVGSFARSSTLANGIGFRDETFVDEILEKQADMIRYLKHHNTHLGRKILQLSHQLGHNNS